MEMGYKIDKVGFISPRSNISITIGLLTISWSIVNECDDYTFILQLR